MAWQRIGQEADFRRLLEEAELEEITITRRDLSYPLPDTGAWWDLLWNAGFRGLLEQLSPNDLARFRHEHLREMAARTGPEGLPLKVEALYASGRVPG